MRNFVRVTIGCLLVAGTFASISLMQPAASDEVSAEPNGTKGNGTDSDERIRPYCEDWEKPAFAFFVTGRQHGYIEPCGCTGLDFQKGGLARRETLYRDLKSRGWPIVPIDVGNQVRRFGLQPAIKFQTTMAALRGMKYTAVGLGPDDLRLDSGDLLSEIVTEGTPLVSANVTIFGQQISDGLKIVDAGGYRIGITSVLGKKEQKSIRGSEISFTDAATAIAQAHDKFVKAKCKLMVLLCHASTEETLQLATSSEKAKKFNVVITAGGADEPALLPELIKGTKQSFLIQTGKKGMYVGVVGIYPDQDQPLRYERIPLDKRFKDSPEMLQSLKNYQEQLQTLYELDWTRLVTKPVDHPTGRKFVGSEACKDCHEHAFEVWEKTPHHEATHSIAYPNERSDIPRHFDPECLSCHVTGWDPKAYFPYISGYEALEKSKHLHGNGCENCHGPGSAHVAAESGEGDFTEADIEMLQKSMQLPLAKAEDHCLKCHDQDNDPDFQEAGAFDKYWEKIKHYE